MIGISISNNKKDDNNIDTETQFIKHVNGKYKPNKHKKSNILLF